MTSQPTPALPTSDLEALRDTLARRHVARVPERTAAARALREFGSAGVPVLQWALADPSSHVRATVVQSLAAIGDPAAIRLLVGATEDHAPEVAIAAVDGHSTLGEVAAVDGWRGDVRHRDDAVRAASVDAPGWSETVRVAETLHSAFQDPSPLVRRAAAEGLGKLGVPHSAFYLERALEDRSVLVQAAAVEALRRTLNDGVVDRMCGFLAHTELPIQLAAVRALGATHDPRAVDPLLRMLTKQSLLRARRFHAYGGLVLGAGILYHLVLGIRLAARLGIFDPAVTGALLLTALYIGALVLKRRHSVVIAAIGKALAEIAAHAPTRDLHTAVPQLRALAADRILVNPQIRRSCVNAAREIEALTADLTRLPLPATAPTPSVSSLPLPSPGPPDADSRRT